MAQKKKNKKVIKYRRPLSINIGLIFFAIIFVYMSFYVYTYLKKEKIQFYEVVEGNIVNDREYTGIAIRDENVQYTDRAGYINYYVREGKRAAIGSRIYSIDETGTLAGFLEEHPDSSLTLTDDNVTDIKRQLVSFAEGWDPDEFNDTYNLYTSLEATVLEYANFNTIGSLDSLIESSGWNFWQATSPVSGVVSYSIDGYEGLEPNQVTSATFDTSSYSKAITKAGQLIERNAPVYKLVTSDDWSIVFPMTEEDIDNYGSRSSLHINFSTTDLDADAAFSLITGTDGGTYGRLDLDKYMVQFISDRFIRFEIDTRSITGLKIPVKAVTSKEFYLVPVDYLAHGGDSPDPGFLKEVYTEDGTLIEFVPTTLYYFDGDYYYIDKSESAPIQGGDYLVMPDSSSRFQVGRTDSLLGVYNINKGYAVFKQIDIINSNEEYYTVRKGQDYGLSVYDHIVLNADTVYEGQLVYQ